MVADKTQDKPTVEELLAKKQRNRADRSRFAQILRRKKSGYAPVRSNQPR